MKEPLSVRIYKFTKEARPGWSVERLEDETYFPDWISEIRELEAEIERLKERLAIEIKWGHQNCTPENCLSSGEDCPAALAGAGETEKEVVR